MKWFKRKKHKQQEETAVDEQSLDDAQDSNTEEDASTQADADSSAQQQHSEREVKEQPARDEEVQARHQEQAEEALIEPEQSLAEQQPEALKPAQDITPAGSQQSPKKEKKGLFSRLVKGLEKTSQSFGDGLGALFLGAKEIDEDLLEDIETQMLMADVGIEATAKIVDELTAKVQRKELYDTRALFNSLQTALEELLQPVEQPLHIDNAHQPYVILMVGVNGAGKTTTIGKLAKRLQNEGRQVMLAAGDTFRAAAVEQLQVWGERNKIPVVAQQQGSDSASVIYEALDSAIARGTDVLIADTAGRLHSQDNLMEELKKIVRVIKKRLPSAPHEVMLVLDASTGQNAIAQAEHFQRAVGVSGVTVTKLDGTAKGGVVFAISQQLQLPIRFIGVGETVDDLREFNAHDFVRALFDQSER